MQGFVFVLIILLGVLLLLAAIYLLVLVRPRRTRAMDEVLLCDYAHRGLYGYGIAENSLAAFSLAALRGFGIELDVQLSRDGVVMVFHDDTLQRMAGVQGRLRDFSAQELGSLSLGGTDQTIPTLAQVLSVVDGRVPLLIEMKGESFDTSLCDKLLQELQGYDGAYCIESFNPLLLRRMRALLPGKAYGLLYTNVCREKKKRSVLNMLLTAMALNVVARPDFIAYNQKDRRTLPVWVTTKLYRAPHFVWTITPQDALYIDHDESEHLIFEQKPRE